MFQMEMDKLCGVFLNTYYTLGLRTKLHVDLNHHSKIQEAENIWQTREKSQCGKSGGRRLAYLAHTTKQGRREAMNKTRTEKELGAEF